MIKKGEAGFSIVEMVLAIVVGISFISSITVIANNYARLSRQSRDLILANSYAEGKIEAIRNNGFNSLNTGTTSLNSELPSQIPSPKSGSMTVSLPQTGLKKVDITINYTENGLSRSYQYSTYVGEIGVGQ